LDAYNALQNLDRQPSSQQTADDRLPAGSEQLLPAKPALRCLLKQAEQPASHKSANGRGRDDRPPLFLIENVSLPFASPPIDSKAADVSQRFEEKMQFGMEDSGEQW